MKGETLTEVLVSVLIGGLAAAMLAMAVSVGTNIATNSRENMDNYYNDSNAMVEQSDETKMGDGVITLTADGGTQISLAGESSLDVAFYSPDPNADGALPISYQAESGDGS